MGYSGGGVSMFAAVTEDPELRDRIDKLVAISTPLDGEFLAQELEPVSKPLQDMF